VRCDEDRYFRHDDASEQDQQTRCQPQQRCQQASDCSRAQQQGASCDFDAEMERFMASLKRDAQGSQSQQQNISRAAADLASAGRKQHSQQRHDNFEGL
jgi:hypothetical protein